MELSNNSMDFGFSLGVLHHTIDVQSNLNNCVDKLKKILHSFYIYIINLKINLLYIKFFGKYLIYLEK